MSQRGRTRRRWLSLSAAVLVASTTIHAQSSGKKALISNDEDFAKSVKEWTTRPDFISPLVDHLPKVAGIPSPKDVLGHHIGEPKKLTYYADILKYYRTLAAATPRVKVVTIGRSNEDRELVVVFVGSDESIKNLEQYRTYLGQLADPAKADRRSGRTSHRQGQAAVPPVGRAPQRRSRAVRDADGADVSARD